MEKFKILEKGEIYFFYRNKLDTQKAHSVTDVQRFYFMLLPSEKKKGRLFIVGKKKLPSIKKKGSSFDSRGWIINYHTGTKKQLAKELYSLNYKTKTKGRRWQPESIPLGEGAYRLIIHDDKTELAYHLSAPSSMGKAQKDLGIAKEGVYLLAVKNPNIKVSGFPEEKPNFPKKLEKQFGSHRWLAVFDPKFLDYDRAQLLLIGAHSHLADIGMQITEKADLFRALSLKKDNWPTESLYKGEFAKPRFPMKTD